MLGVGTNMVKSIRYWMQACGLLAKDGNKEILSDMAEIIYMNDPYLEDIFSLWILHSNIAKNIEQATVWYMFLIGLMLILSTKLICKRKCNRNCLIILGNK